MNINGLLNQLRLTNATFCSHVYIADYIIGHIKFYKPINVYKTNNKLAFDLIIR